MTRTCPSYPAREKADSTDTPRPAATMDSMAASSDAVTSSRVASGGRNCVTYCSGQERNVSCSSRSKGMAASVHGKSGGTTATNGASVRGVQ